MSENTTDNGRESGTMSRPVPLSRIGGSPFVSTAGVLGGEPAEATNV